MYYYEFTLIYSDDSQSTMTTYSDYQDTLAYCNEGIRAGWLKDFDYKIVAEEY